MHVSGCPLRFDFSAMNEEGVCKDRCDVRGSYTYNTAVYGWELRFQYHLVYFVRRGCAPRLIAIFPMDTPNRNIQLPSEPFKERHFSCVFDLTSSGFARSTATAPKLLN